MNEVYAVGDLHGDWGRLNELINKKSPSIILQCGDFGWWPKLEVKKPVLYDMQKEWKLRGVKHKSTHIFWCDGNHEDHWNLRDNVGLIDYGNVHYQERGSTLILPDGRSVLFLGGAESVDRDQRILGIDWFPEELISSDDLDHALRFNLSKIDIVVSHTCPEEFDMTSNSFKINDPSRVALSRVLEKYKPDLWYFGHWHKHKKGQYLNTKWTALDYPGHGGVWWEMLK